MSWMNPHIPTFTVLSTTEQIEHSFLRLDSSVYRRWLTNFLIKNVNTGLYPVQCVHAQILHRSEKKPAATGRLPAGRNSFRPNMSFDPNTSFDPKTYFLVLSHHVIWVYSVMKPDALKHFTSDSWQSEPSGPLHQTAACNYSADR